LPSYSPPSIDMIPCSREFVGDTGNQATVQATKITQFIANENYTIKCLRM
jgi:hypothetical protein